MMMTNQLGLAVARAQLGESERALAPRRRSSRQAARDVTVMFR